MFTPGRRQLPIRAEFFGDEIESLREFDLDTQTSLRNLNNVELLLGAADDQSGRVRDYIGQEHLRIVIEEEDEAADVRISEGWVESQDAAEDFSGAFVDCEIGEFDTGEFIVAEAKRQQFFCPPNGLARERCTDRNLFPDRRRDRAFPRDHGGSQGFVRRN